MVEVVCSHARGMALEMAIPVCLLVDPPLLSKLKYQQTTGWIAMKFCADIHGSQRMNPAIT